MRKIYRNKNNSKVIDNYIYLFISIFLYSFFGILFSIFTNSLYRLPQTIAFIFFLVITFKLVSSYINQKRKNILFSIFLILQFFIIIRIDLFSVNELRLILFDSNHFLSYLIPLVILIPIRLNNMNKIFYSFLIFSIAFLILNFFLIVKFPVNNFTDLIVISSLPPAGILLLLSKYSKKIIIIPALVVVFSILVIGLIYGRRSVIISATLFILFSYFINVIFNKRVRNSLKIVSLVIIATLSFYTINYFINTVDRSKFAIFDRADEDSRSYVLNAFNKDFKFNDYIIGRGIDGAYYNPIKYWNFDNKESKKVSYRTNIENGFLYIILKGGIFWLFLFLIIMFKAIYLGFFKTKNLFTKALVCYLLIYFIEMLAYGQPTFSIKYFLVWICISLCSSRRFRNINEKQLVSLINRNKFVKFKKNQKTEDVNYESISDL